MAEYNFYIQPYRKNGTKYEAKTLYNIESFFSPSNTDKAYTAQLHYKSIAGMEAYGKPRPYVENFAESDMASVELATDDPREQTDITRAFIQYLQANQIVITDPDTGQPYGAFGGGQEYPFWFGGTSPDTAVTKISKNGDGIF